MSATQRTTSRQRIAVPARLTWKDQGGAIRFASVTTRDLSASGAFVECDGAAPLPLFRLVHLQLEQAPLEPSHPLTSGRVLAAVWRIERGQTACAAEGYALRFLVDPTAGAARPHTVRTPIAAAC